MFSLYLYRSERSGRFLLRDRSKSTNKNENKTHVIGLGQTGPLGLNPIMQKTSYYDNSGLFGGYSYPKSDSFNYGSSHQPYPSSNIENDFQGPVCTIQTSTIRPPNHKGGDINGSCMRTGNSQGNSQPVNTGEHQQAPPLPASSPNPSGASTQKKKTSPNGASNTATPVITKQIFPWMKESRQNSKQKGNSNSCTTAGITTEGLLHLRGLFVVGWILFYGCVYSCVPIFKG